MKRWAWYAGGAVVVAALVAVCYEASNPRRAPETALIDHLRQQNRSLHTKNRILRAHNATLVTERNKALLERDSLKAVSDDATKELRRARTALPSTPTAAQLPESYRESLRQLDAAIAELARKDEIIRRDALALAQSAEIEANLRAEVANTNVMLSNANKQAADWERQFHKLNEEKHPRCGRKCGMVIGGAVVVLTAVGAKKIQTLIEGHP